MLLSSGLRTRLSQYHWQTAQLKRGTQKGKRRSAAFGSSLDFSDFRAYQPGDDVRQIDWNVYARTNRHYIKRYLDEQELSLAVYLDCSLSMGLEKEKWQMAKSLAAAIGYTGLVNDDRVSVIPVSEKGLAFSRKKGVVFANQMLRQMESFEAGESGSFTEKLPRYRQQKTALSFIISDFLEPVEQVADRLKLLQTNQQLRVIHLLSEKEMNPELSGDVKLINVEQETDTVQVSVTRGVISSYKERLREHCRLIEKTCMDRGIGYVQVSTGQSIDEILFSRMRKKGWLA